MRFLHRLLLTIVCITAIVFLLSALVNFDYLAALKEHHKLGMFLVSFVSSSIFFVFSSELAIVAATKFITVWDILLYATLGSTLGAVVNYFIGFKGLHRFVTGGSKEEKQATKWFSRWGPGVVFFAAGIPFVGDALTIVAGILRMNFAAFLTFSLAGRALKTAVLVYSGSTLLGTLGV